MGPLEYKAERERRGTQEEVAALLGVSRVTVARREIGMRPVSREAWIALMALPERIEKGNKYGLISIAARLALCKVLMELEEVCENQKTISTDKLQSMLDKVSSKLKYESVHVRNIAMKL